VGQPVDQGNGQATDEGASVQQERHEEGGQTEEKRAGETRSHPLEGAALHSAHPQRSCGRRQLTPIMAVPGASSG
jgi:hypothetical protein